jgi:hypothetical protein
MRGGMRLINESVTPIGRGPRNFIGEPLVRLVGWSNLRQFLDSLEESGELLRISRPVDIELEAGCIADRVVKMGGRALLFEQPRLPDGSISEMPLAMNLFGTPERVKMALGVDEYSEIGKRLVGLMKPDVAAMAGRPWKGIPLAKQALKMAPKRVKKAACQEVVVENPDLTKLPIPRTWPLDAGHTMTLPLVVTKDAATGEQNLGMYRAQVYGPTECGLHWQMHKHGADHADAHRHNEGNASGEGDDIRIPVAICLGGPPEPSPHCPTISQSTCSPPFCQTADYPSLRRRHRTYGFQPRLMSSSRVTLFQVRRGLRGRSETISESTAWRASIRFCMLRRLLTERSLSFQ